MKAEFKRLRNISKTYDQQGEIFFTCRNYNSQPKKVREKIQKVCEKAGGDYAQELFVYLTTDISWTQLCMDYYISESTLNRIRRRFYELW